MGGSYGSRFTGEMAGLVTKILVNIGIGAFVIRLRSENRQIKQHATSVRILALGGRRGLMRHRLKRQVLAALFLTLCYAPVAALRALSKDDQLGDMRKRMVGVADPRH